MNTPCGSCGAPRPKVARFCPACGAPTLEHRRVLLDRERAERQRTTRAALAFGVTCSATLFGLLGGAGLLGDAGEWPAMLAVSLAVFGAAATAAMMLGDPRATLPLALSGRWCAAAVPTAALSLAAAFAITWLYTGGSGGGYGSPSVAVWVGVVVLAPLGEEWLCRGAAWRAATQLAAPRTALVLTAILFAFLHGLGGGYLLELPHRFVAGLLFGWLRWRSGSLVPGVLAHLLHNLGAMLLVA